VCGREVDGQIGLRAARRRGRRRSPTSAARSPVSRSLRTSSCSGSSSRRNTRRSASGTAPSQASWVWRLISQNGAGPSRRCGAPTPPAARWCNRPRSAFSARPGRRVSLRNPAARRMLAYETETELLSRHLDRDVFKEPARGLLPHADERDGGAIEARRSGGGGRRGDHVRLYGRASPRGRPGECHEVFAETSVSGAAWKTAPARRRWRIGQLTGGTRTTSQSTDDHPRQRRALAADLMRRACATSLAASAAGLDGESAVGICPPLDADARADSSGHLLNDLAAVLRRVLPRTSRLVLCMRTCPRSRRNGTPSSRSCWNS